MDFPIDGQTILIILVVLAGLLVVLSLLFQGSAEGGFSIFNKIKFWFKGKEKSDRKEINQAGIAIGDRAQIQANEIVGGDKVGGDKTETHIHQENPPKPLPNLQLYFVDLNGELKKEIKVYQFTTGTSSDIFFQLRLMNEAKGTTAKGIGINLEFSDRRVDPSKEIQFYRLSLSSGWETIESKISNSLPAHFSLNNSDLIGYSDQPIHNVKFRFRLPEKSSGHILGQYTASSHEPFTERIGELILSSNNWNLQW